MESSGYWTKLSNARSSRRRALLSAGGLGISAAILAACGGDGEPKEQASGLVRRAVDESKQAKRGGTLKLNLTRDFVGSDIWHNSAPFSVISKSTSSSLFHIKPGHLENSAGDVGGDLAESWEYSADGLQLTVKLRPNLFWHPVAPVNGRQLNIDDVNYTWSRWSEVGQNRGQFLNSVSASAPILSMTTPDPRTLVFKLKFPVAGLLGLLTNVIPGYLLFAPKEAGSQYDFRNTIIGSGPWYVSSYQPSIGVTLKRNPKYYDTERPYADEVNLPIISEYAAQLAQFRTGSVHYMSVRAEDILVTKSDVPELELYSPPGFATRGNYAYFGWRPNSAFRDERIRQAVSNSWDRDAFIEVFYNVSKFQSEGLPMETRWNSSCLDGSFFEGWWLDPRSKDFGPNSKYFQYDVAEAKKLLAAAGFASGVEQQSSYGPEGYPGIENEIQVLQGMNADAGFRFKDNVMPFVTDFTPRYRDSRGNFEGIAYRNTGAVLPDAIERLLLEYSEAGQAFFVINDGKPDPQLESMITKGRGELDNEKRKAVGYDIQRYLAKAMYAIKMPGAANTFNLQWPVVRNRYSFNGDGRDSGYYYIALDESLPPVNKKA